MRKYILDLTVTSNVRMNGHSALLKLTALQPLPDMKPGQFVEVRVDHSPTTFLRRPISINFIDRANNELWLLIQEVGEGTRQITRTPVGGTLNIVLPLGNGFSLYSGQNNRPLLVGGGIGTAPLLYLGAQLKQIGVIPTFLLGGRSAQDLLQLNEFREMGPVYVTTEDGTLGERGYVTQHTLLQSPDVRFNRIYVCGPKPMMKAVAAYARNHEIECEVSLENTMACGIGACLCCVENTSEGHVCVCKEGPVFNINRLLW